MNNLFLSVMSYAFAGFLITLAIVQILKSISTKEIKKIGVIAELNKKINVNMKQHEIDALREEVLKEASKATSTYVKVELLNILLFLEDINMIAMQEHIEHNDIRKIGEQCYRKMCKICDSEDELSRFLSFWKLMNKKVEHRTFTIDDRKMAYRAGKNGWYQEKNYGGKPTVGKFKGTEKEYIDTVKKRNKNGNQGTN